MSAIGGEGRQSSATRRRTSAGALLLAGALVLLSGCATNTMTGRSQFLMVSEQQAISGAASAYSSMIGQFHKKNKVESGTERAERVREITNRLVAEAVRFRPDSATWSWEVQVIDEPKTVNAFCMAGGKMAIYTGLIQKLNATDDEIAAVMGHEIGHALADHTREKMSVGMAAGLGVTVLAAIVSSRSNDPTAFGRNYHVFAMGAALGVTLPNSREAENEADQIGIELAARAGFDPRAAVSLWKKMAAEGGAPPEFLSTHPNPENRVQRLDALVAKVDPLYEMAKQGKSTADIPAFVHLSDKSTRTRYVSKDDKEDSGPRSPVPGPLSREEYAARLAAEPQVMTFISEEFDRFKRGDVVFACTYECLLGYTWHRGDWKRMYEKQQWRDLAIAVTKTGYLNDLAYFYLAEAANGLKLADAARKYYARAIDAAKGEKTCAGGLMDTCDGLDVARLAQTALAR